MTLALLSLGLAFAVGVAAYSGDRRMTERTLHSLAPSPPDWLERAGVPEADVLELPGGSLHRGWVLESWNRNVARTYHLGDVPADQLPYSEVGLDRDGGVALVGGPKVRSRYLVVDDAGTRIDLVGTRLRRPEQGLSLYRTDGALRVHSLAFGVDADGWARSVVRYLVFPGPVSRGSYRVRLSLPAGRPARTVELEAGPVRKRLRLRPGAPLTARIPVSIFPVPELAIRVDRADFIDADKPHPRLVAAHVDRLEFVAAKGSRN